MSHESANMERKCFDELSAGCLAESTRLPMRDCGTVSTERELALAEDSRKRLGIKTATVNNAAAELSGGGVSLIGDTSNGESQT